MRPTRVPALLLALALTAACGGDTPPEDPTDDAPEVAEDAGDDDVDVDDDAVDDEPEVDASDPDASADTDGMVLTGAGLQLVVPEDWIVLGDDAEFDPDALADAAAAMGVSPEQLEAQLQQAEALALDPVPVDDFADNVNITVVPGPPELPDEDLLRADYAQIGAEVTEVADRDTPVGEGVHVAYTLDVGTTVYGVGLFVVVDDQLVTVTASSGQDGVAGPLLDGIIATLQPAA